MTVRIACDKHAKPHVIATFVMLDGAWTELPGRSAQQKRSRTASPPLPPKSDIDGWLASLGPRSDRPETGRTVHEGQLADPYVDHVSSLTRGSMSHRTYDLTCPRCRSRSRHSTVRMTESNLWAILDLIVRPGEPRAQVTPEFLQKVDAARRA